MLIPSANVGHVLSHTSLSRRVNANSQRLLRTVEEVHKLIKKGEC